MHLFFGDMERGPGYSLTPFKTVSTFHDPKWNHLHIVFTISCNHFISFELMLHLLSTIFWLLSLTINSSEQVSYFTTLNVSPFGGPCHQNHLPRECYSTGSLDLWISVNITIHVWAGECGKAAKCSFHSVQDSVLVYWEQLRNSQDKVQEGGAM